MKWKDSTDTVFGTIHVDYPNREALEQDLHDFWDSIPAESKNNDHSRVAVNVRDCKSGREFYLNKTFPFDDCVSVLLMNNSKGMR